MKLEFQCYAHVGDKNAKTLFPPLVGNWDVEREYPVLAMKERRDWPRFWRKVRVVTLPDEDGIPREVDQSSFRVCRIIFPPDLVARMDANEVAAIRLNQVVMKIAERLGMVKKEQPGKDGEKRLITPATLSPGGRR